MELVELAPPAQAQLTETRAVTEAVPPEEEEEEPHKVDPEAMAEMAAPGSAS